MKMKKYQSKNKKKKRKKKKNKKNKKKKMMKIWLPNLRQNISPMKMLSQKIQLDHIYYHVSIRM